ncbi:MAG TPA: tetratricopeptide repeat protein, partial [Spirochaetota bacterium]|nr:tetratricopeptide repeat protein [Spirochaetota bacterium]
MASDIETLFEKANDSFYNNDYDTALKLFLEIVEKDKNNYLSYQKIAQIELSRNNLEKAIENFEKC